MPPKNTSKPVTTQYLRLRAKVGNLRSWINPAQKTVFSKALPKNPQAKHSKWFTKPKVSNRGLTHSRLNPHRGCFFSCERLRESKTSLFRKAIGRSLSAFKNCGQHVGVAAAMDNRNDPDGLFVRCVSNQKTIHSDKAQWPRSEVWACVAAMRKSNQSTDRG